VTDAPTLYTLIHPKTFSLIRLHHTFSLILKHSHSSQNTFTDVPAKYILTHPETLLLMPRHTDSLLNFIRKRWLPGGVFICSISRLHPQILVVFESFLRGGPNFDLNKSVPCGFKHSCSAMATQQLKEQVQQHDEDAESSKTGCRSPSRAQGKVYEQVPALICYSYARCSLRAAAIWGGDFAHKEQNPPPPIFRARI